MLRNGVDRTKLLSGHFSISASVIGAATAIMVGFALLLLTASPASAQDDPLPPPPALILLCVEQVVGPVAETAGYDASDIGLEIAGIPAVNFGESTDGCGPNGDFEGAPDGALGYVESAIPASAAITLTTVMPDGKIGPVDVECSGDGTSVPQSGPDAISIEVTPEGVNGAIRCTFRSNSVNICVAKIVEPQGYFGGARPVDVSFELRIGDTVEPAPAFTEVQSEFCGEFFYDDGQPLDAVAFTEFLVAPDQVVTIAEIAPADGSLGPRDNECYFQDGPFNDDPEIVDDEDDATAQAFARVDEGPMLCEFVNDGVIVCVSKILTPTALEVLGDVRARDFDFTVTLRDGTPLTTLDGQDDMTRRPSELCEDFVSQPEAPPRALRYGQFLLAPGTRFTISETGPDGVARIVGASSADCSQDNLIDLVEEPEVLALEDGTEVLAERVEPGPALGSANGRARRNRPPVACEFVNDAVRVCVSNYLGFIADEAGFRARDFDIAATLRDGTPLIALDGQDDMRNSPPDGCANVQRPRIGPGGRAERHGEFFVAPGTRFRVIETVPGNGVSPVLSGCGEEPFDVQPDTSLSINGRGTDQVIYCTFVNDSARICVATEILPTALDAPDNFRARDYDFDITKPNGEVLVHLDGQEDMSRNPMGDCSAVGGGPARAFRYGTAYVAPGTTFRIAQTDIVGPIDPVASACGFGNGVDDEFLVERAEPGDVIVLPSGPATADGSVPPFIGPSTECNFRNDSVRVCVSKHVRAVARDAGFVATDFSFALTTRDGAPIGSVAGADLAAEPTRGCDTDVDRTGPAAAWGFHEFFVTPGERVTLNETGAADAPIGTVRSRCRQEQVQEEDDDFPPPPQPPFIGNALLAEAVTAAESAILGSANGRARYNRGPLVCEFANNSVRVCVVKTVGTNALDEGWLASDFPVSLAYGATVTAASNPAAVAEDCGDALDASASGYTEFFAPPNVPFVVSEAIPPGRPIALVSKGCAQGEVDVTGAPTGMLNTVTATGSAGNPPVLCTLVNDAARVCIAKSLGENAIEAGAVAADGQVNLVVDGVTATRFLSPDTDPPAGCAAVPTTLDSAYTQFFVAPGATFELSESVAEDSIAGLAAISCDDVPGDPAGSPAITHTAGVSEATVVVCVLVNDSVRVTINKELVNDDEPSEFTSEIGDFAFDVFDALGAKLLTGTDPDTDPEIGFSFFVAPNQTLTVSELERAGYEVTAASCAVGDVPGETTAASQVTLVLPAAVTEASCTFVNDDIALIPVCAGQTLAPGLTDFVLSDLGIELYRDGELIANVTGDAPGDPLCGPVVAALSPAGAEAELSNDNILLARVLPATTPYTMVQTFPAAAGQRLESIELTCVLVGVGSAQALTAAQTVFTPTTSTTQVDCQLSAQAVQIPARISVAVVGNGPLTPADIMLAVRSGATGEVVLDGVGPELTIADLRSGVYTIELPDSSRYRLQSAACDGESVLAFDILDANAAGARCELVIDSLKLVPAIRATSPAVETDEEADPAAKVAVPAAAPVSTDVISLSSLATTGGSSSATASIGLGFLAAGAGLAGLARTRRRRT